MIPSVTNGATIGSAASKKHEKLPRGLSATMIVLPRNHREQHRTSRSCLLMTARMAPIFREAFQKCMQGGRGRSAQTHLPSVGAAISPTETASRAASWRDYLLSGSLYLKEWTAQPGWELPYVSGQSAAGSCCSLRLITCCESGEAPAASITRTSSPGFRTISLHSRSALLRETRKPCDSDCRNGAKD
jgi:hypothetical protein